VRFDVHTDLFNAIVIILQRTPIQGAIADFQNFNWRGDRTETCGMRSDRRFNFRGDRTETFGDRGDRQNFNLRGERIRCLWERGAIARTSI